MARRASFDAAALDFHFTPAGTPRPPRSERYVAAGGLTAAENHKLTASLAGENVGHIEWHPQLGRVEMVKTHRDYRGKGIATALWQAAHVHAARNGVVAPKHSDIQLPDGRAWAQGMTAKSGPKPIPKKRVSRQPVEGQQNLF